VVLVTESYKFLSWVVEFPFTGHDIMAFSCAILFFYLSMRVPIPSDFSDDKNILDRSIHPPRVYCGSSGNVVVVLFSNRDTVCSRLLYTDHITMPCLVMKTLSKDFIHKEGCSCADFFY
jgi:hypothetical protein